MRSSLSVVSVMNVERKRGRINPSSSPWLIRYSPWKSTNESSTTSKGKLAPVEKVIKKFRSNRRPPTSRSDCMSHCVLKRQMKPCACLLSCHLLWAVTIKKRHWGSCPCRQRCFFFFWLQDSVLLLHSSLLEGNKPTSTNLIFDASVIANSFLPQH